jgi:hypothetical protein
LDKGPVTAKEQRRGVAIALPGLSVNVYSIEYNQPFGEETLK